MMALCPDAVDMQHFNKEKWYSRSAADASAELGAKGRDLILAGMRRALGLKPST